MALILLQSYMLCLARAQADTGEARLENIIVSNTRDDLMIYLNVKGAFTPEMNEAILNGVPATFTFFITLDRIRHMWLNKEIADIKVTHTIKYDNLKKEFTVRRSWDHNRPIITRSFEEAQSLISDIDSLEIVPLTMLTKDQEYRLSIKAELSKMTLPFYLHYVLFFVSFWDFETDWYTIDFTY